MEYLFNWRLLTPMQVCDRHDTFTLLFDLFYQHDDILRLRRLGTLSVELSSF